MNIGLNNSEREWLLRIRSTLRKRISQNNNTPEPEPTTPSNDEIWYTSTDGEIITPYSSGFKDLTITSNTYENGKGVIKLSGELTELTGNVFGMLTNLNTITFPDSLTKISTSAFLSSTLTSIIIPKNVNDIGYGLFSGCTNLTSITVDSENSVYSSQDSNVIIKTLDNTLMAGCKTSVIPEGVVVIEQFAFDQLSPMTSITIPSTVTSINDYAFGECTGLTSITLLPTNPPTITAYTFDGVPATVPIYVPSNSVDDYKAAEVWSTRATYIQEIQ